MVYGKCRLQGDIQIGTTDLRCFAQKTKHQPNPFIFRLSAKLFLAISRYFPLFLAISRYFCLHDVQIYLDIEICPKSNHILHQSAHWEHQTWSSQYKTAINYRKNNFAIETVDYIAIENELEFGTKLESSRHNSTTHSYTALNAYWYVPCNFSLSNRTVSLTTFFPYTQLISVKFVHES